MFNIPENILSQIKEAMKRPEGTVTFESEIDDLFNKEMPGGIIFKVITGGHIFLLERDNNLNVNFYHSSLGLGTRVATINLGKIKEARKIFWALVWSPSEIRLAIGPRIEGGELHTAQGVQSKKKFRIVGEEIMQIGDEGVEVMEARIFSDGKYVLEPTAIEAWNNTINAVEILQSGVSEKGYLYEVVQSNVSISTLVTGFEIYTRKRCLELEREGIKPDLDALINRVFSNNERINNEPEILKKKVEAIGKTLFQELIQNKIYFQSYDECKRAFAKAYGIKFGELGLNSNELTDLQRTIQFRHKIIHVSPLLSIVNQAEVPAKEPIFSNKDFAKKKIILFDKFIQLLHKATLSLKKVD